MYVYIQLTSWGGLLRIGAQFAVVAQTHTHSKRSPQKPAHLAHDGAPAPASASSASADVFVFFVVSVPATAAPQPPAPAAHLRVGRVWRRIHEEHRRERGLR